mgnify:CR=1 FL=1
MSITTSLVITTIVTPNGPSIMVRKWIIHASWDDCAQHAPVGISDIRCIRLIWILISSQAGLVRAKAHVLNHRCKLDLCIDV